MRYDRFLSRFIVIGLLALIAFSMTLLYTTATYAKGSSRTGNHEDTNGTARTTEEDKSSSSRSSGDSSSSRHSTQETRRVEPEPDRSNDGGGQSNREIRRDPPPPTVERNTYQPPANKGHQRESDAPVYTKREAPKSDGSSHQSNNGNNNSNNGSSSSGSSYSQSGSSSGNRDSGSKSSSSSESRYHPGNKGTGNGGSSGGSSSSGSSYNKSDSSSDHRNSGTGSSSSSETRYTPGGKGTGNSGSGGSSSSSGTRYTPSDKTNSHRNSGSGSSSTETRSNNGSSNSGTVLKSTTNHRSVDIKNSSSAGSRVDLKSSRDTSYAIPQAALRRDVPKSTHIPNVTGVFRNDYSQLGDIWKSRREHQNDRHGNDGRFDRNNNRSHTNVSINFNFFPNSRYRYYAYDYDPWYSYPSVYCYYGGLFPPYIYGHRVTYVHHNIVTYRYVEIPIAVIYREKASYRSDADDYYLSHYRYSDLSDALRNIEKAWETGDADRFTDHVLRGEKVDIYLKDDYSYSLESEDFEEMTRDAMSHIDTYKFDIYRVRERDSRTMVAYAEHQYRDDDTYDRDAADNVFGDRFEPRLNKVYVQYTLERIDRDWFITEVATSPTKEY